MVYHPTEKLNIVIRKLAARLLIELSFKNERSQMMMCESFSFTPVSGYVALNPLPMAIQERLRKDPSVLNELKNLQYH